MSWFDFFKHLFGGDRSVAILRSDRSDFLQAVDAALSDCVFLLQLDERVFHLLRE